MGERHGSAADAALLTEGERLVGRPLKSEVVAGVPHYVPGQYDAETFGVMEGFFTHEPREIARLTYVDRMGHACVVLVARPPGGEWFATWASRSGQHYRSEAARVRPDFTLSENMLAALASARVSALPADESSGGAR